MKCSPTISLSAALGFALVLPSRGWAQDYIVRTVIKVPLRYCISNKQ